jgi:hypothetical protein
VPDLFVCEDRALYSSTQFYIRGRARAISRNGGVRWNTRWVNVSHLFAELEIGFEEIDDGLWNVYFGPVWLGRFHEEVGRIVDQLGRPMRRSGDNHKGRNHQKVLPIT